MMFCKNCGTQLNDGSKFCTKCGAKMEAEAAVPQAAQSGTSDVHSPVQRQSARPTQPANGKSKLPLVAAIFGLAGFIYWLVMMFAPVLARADGSGSDSLFPILMSSMNERATTQNMPFSIILLSVYLVVAMLAPIPAVILNFLSWKDNDKKKCLISGILYVLTLNVVSAPLSFVAFAKFGKALKAPGQ